MPLDDLQKGLPLGWVAEEIAEDRCLFWNEKLQTSSWVHPDGNDLHEIRTLYIGGNLAGALNHLRYPDKARTLWVDAICINQNDISEKNIQVPRMADIFRSAVRVVIWLGLESDNSTLALSTLDYLAAQVEITKASWVRPSPGCVHQDWFHSLTGMPYDDSTWQAIVDLTNPDTTKRLTALQTWKPDNLMTGIYPTGESNLDAFITTLVQGKLRDRFPTIVTWSSLQELQSKLKELLASSTDPPLLLAKRGILVLAIRTHSRVSDIICAFLGCKVLVILRPWTGGCFQVVGSCYLHGFTSAEAFLGPLPAPWVMQYKPDSCGVQTPYFFNKDTKEAVQQDPRLGELPVMWKAIQKDRTKDDPQFLSLFRNSLTGELMNSDPRMLPEALRDRGVRLQSFKLV
ncbi:Heterokaryon incompatibility protein 6, OR allele [Fusarium oxysporum f. sp. cubense race 1]|uniref:Heterokaryon incompatibility protein 6, OR allele n=1 Tax=Fusarium oxysporum f. sp. cubense (strain race 1) TaxID=1229664 RepID=N4U044_FUSC1|nr:Heterokaryon incompatibility protein 6, OR allele [Fusarium oxysporum f. sp. cubense race 1]